MSTSIKRLKPNHFRPQDTHIPNQFRSLPEIKSSSTPCAEIKSISTNQTETSLSRYSHQKEAICGPKTRGHFDHHHPHKNRVNRSSHLNQVYFGPHTVNFDPLHEKQAAFDPNTKTNSNSLPYTKINITSTPLLKSSQFYPHPKMMSISMPPHKNQINFVPHTKSQLFFEPHAIPKLIPISTLKSSQFRSPP